MLDDIWMLYKCIYEYIYLLYTFVSCVHAFYFYVCGGYENIKVMLRGEKVIWKEVKIE